MKLLQFNSSTFGTVWVNPMHIVFVSAQSEDQKAILWLSIQNGAGANGGGAPFQLWLDDPYHHVLTEIGLLRD